MRENYALRYLARLVNWNDTRLANEVGWLRRMAAYKFDTYQDFIAGERFIAALIHWLSQFDKADRDFAFSLLRDYLIFLSAGEIQHLVRRTVPAHFHPLWVQRVAHERRIAPYEIWASEQSAAAYRRLMRRSLFIGLSDGARMDVFRRANVGVISNEQIAVTYELSATKLDSLLKDLRKDEQAADARFEMVFLIDDFLGSGTTLCRKNQEQVWKGKVARFGDNIAPKVATCFSDSFEIVAHHYVAMENGLERARTNLASFSQETTHAFFRGKNFRLTSDLLLNNAARFPAGADARMDAFLRKYYDPEIMTPSLLEGGCHVQNGFADCGLVLVLEHNTPNNSLAILWATSTKPTSHRKMRPLFSRRQRHE